jgi:hypothetical protein
MKTNTNKYAAALLGAALILSGSALAGPGPQTQPPTIARSQKKAVLVVTRPAVKAQRDYKSVAGTRPEVRFVTGPRGNLVSIR